MARDLLTLTEVSKRTGISMPTLLRYKKAHQSRIPSRGRGRKQRYPEAALAVFRQIRSESRPGRQTKAARRPSRKGGRASASGLTLTEVSRRTGISYPTLLRYVHGFPDRLPHKGHGRGRRFMPDALPVFEEIRRDSRPGRKPARPDVAQTSAASAATAGPDSLGRRLSSIEKGQSVIARELRALARRLERPMKVTFRR